MYRHRQRASVRSLLLTSLVLVALMAMGGYGQLARAQDATPATAGPFTLPYAPSPELCVAEPRPVEDYEALLGSPEAGELPPTVLTAGQAADQATIDRIVATVVVIAACQNANDFRRLDGLYTDAGYLEDSGGGIEQETLDFMLATHEPTDEADWQVVYDVSAVQRLADGWVAAIVQWGPDGIYGIDLMIFAEQDGAFLIDQWVDEPFDIVPDFG